MASHHNPKTYKTKKLLSGARSLGNAIKNVGDKVTGGGVTPTSSSNKFSKFKTPKIAPRVTNRGNEFIRMVNAPKPPKITVKQKPNPKPRGYDFFQRLIKGNSYTKQQAQLDPYRNMVNSRRNMERANDYARNDTPERQAELKAMQNYTSGYAQEYATNNLHHSNEWFNDADRFGDSVIGNPASDDPNQTTILDSYLSSDEELEDMEQYEEYLNRYTLVQEWFRKNTIWTEVYDASKESEDGSTYPYTVVQTIDPNAELPPWVVNTPQNQEQWSVYLHRSDYDIQMMNEQGDRYHKSLREYAAKQAQMEAENESVEGKVGSAFSEMGEEGVINSFADVFRASLGRVSDERSSVDQNKMIIPKLGVMQRDPNVTDSTTEDFKNYIRDYWVNPLRTGHFTRFLGNRLFDAMDLIDMPALGVRATLASSSHVLYDGNQMYEGQDAFVYSGGEELQKQIMDMGGRDFLNSSRKVSQGYDPTRAIAEEARQKLRNAGLWYEFQKLQEEWNEYDSGISPLDNLRAAYTTPGKDFYTHTGNLAVDMAADILTDPTMILGGGARSIARGASKNIAQASVERGLKEALKLKNVTNALDDEGQKIVNGFVRKMDSRTVIFKQKDKIDREVDALFDRLIHTKGNEYIVEKLSKNGNAFKDTVKKSIHDHVSNSNAAIVATTKSGKRRAEETFLRAVHNIGYTADKIDSTLLKLAFPEPFILKDSIKASRWAVDNSIVGDFFSTIHNQRVQKRVDAAKVLFGDDYNNPATLNMDQLDHFKKLESGEVDPDFTSISQAINAAKSKMRSMSNTCDTVLHRLRKGSISSDEALDYIHREIKYFAGKNPCNSLDDLDAIVKGGDYYKYLGRSYDSFRSKFKRVEEFISKQRANNEQSFLNELQRVNDVDELDELLIKYKDYLNFSDEEFLLKISAKYNKSSLAPQDLTDALMRLQEDVSGAFSSRHLDLSPESIQNNIKKSAQTAPLDYADPLNGSSKVTIKELNDRFSKAEYSKLKEALDNTEDVDVIPSEVREDNIKEAKSNNPEAELIRSYNKALGDLEYKRRNLGIKADIPRAAYGWYALDDGQVKVSRATWNHNYEYLREGYHDLIQAYDAFVELEFDWFKKPKLDFKEPTNYEEAVQLSEQLLKELEPIKKNIPSPNERNIRKLLSERKASERISKEIEELDKKIAELKSKKLEVENSINKVENEAQREADVEAALTALNEKQLSDVGTKEITEVLENVSEIKGLQRLKAIVSGSEDDFYFEVKDVIKVIDNTFYDVSFAYKFEIPEEAELVLQELHSFRRSLEQTLSTPVSINLGSVYQYQLDRMTVFDYLINDDRLIKFMDTFNSDVRPILEGVKNGTLESVDFVNHSGFYEVLNELSRKINAVGIFHSLDAELSNILNPYQKYAIEDYIFGLSSCKNDNLLNQLTNDHSKLSNAIDEAIYSGYTNNKIGINNARTRMNSINNDIWGKYGDELREDEELQKWVKDIVNASPADPASYVNLQILQSILIDSDAIRHYNELDQYNPVVFAHCSTSGFNPSSSDITGIAYKRWQPISEDASLRDIFESIINQNNKSLCVSDVEGDLSESFLNHIFDVNLSARRKGYDYKLQEYKKIFGKDANRKYAIEADVIGDFCDELLKLSRTSEGDQIIPCLVMHDFEGFNISFLKNKIFKYSDVAEVTELQKIFNNIEMTSENSFDRLKGIVNEQTLTAEQKDLVMGKLYEAVKDLNEVGETFRFLDTQDISSLFRTLSDYIDNGYLYGTQDSVLKQLEEVLTGESGIMTMLSDVGKACHEIKEYSRQAEDWLLFRSSVSDIKSNPIRHTRGENGLQFTLNMRAKHNIADIQTYFDMPSMNEMPLSTLEKMSDVAKYVMKNQNMLVSGVERFLGYYKKSFDEFIAAAKQYALEGSTRVNVDNLNSLDYVALLRTPKSATESYLICLKLYNDLFKLFDQNIIKNLSRGTFENGRFNNYLSIRFVDDYMDPSKFKGFYSVFANERLMSILRGNLDDSIWLRPLRLKDVPPSSLTSKSLLLDKLSKADALKKTYNAVNRKIDSITTLDDMLISRGIRTNKDYKEGMLYQRIAEFMDSIGTKIDDLRFLDDLKIIRSWRSDYCQYYSLQKLMTNGQFDEQKLINELLWNGTGMHVVYSNKYTEKNLSGFVDFIESLDLPYLGMSYEGDAFIVYIKKGYDILENSDEGFRYIKGHNEIISRRNVYDDIPFPEYKELPKYLNEGETLSITRKEYDLLKLIYKDIDYFSDGASRGTLGNRVSMQELEDFYRLIPDTYEDMAIPFDLLQNDMRKSLICDPGFISRESDIFTDILRTFENLERTTGDVKLTTNFVFGEHSDVMMRDVLKDVSNAEALEYLNRNNDYAIIQLKEGDTHCGMFLQEVKPRTEADIERLRNSDAAIVPFELFVELQSRMNYKEANSVLAVFNKALVALKATQLCKAGSWVRNHVDAVTKAILAENEGGVAGAVAMASRDHKAIREVPAVMLMQRREGSRISERTWPELCESYHLGDMTWEDYQLLAGLLDRENIMNNNVHMGYTRQQIKKGKDVSLSSLSDADVAKVWKRTKLGQDTSINMDLKTFNAIRKGEIVPSDELLKHYNEVCRKVLVGLNDTKTSVFDKGVDAIFTPFNISEITARYAQMLWLRDLGYSHNQSIKRVAETQFRTLPNAHFLNKMEMIVPFVTFKYNNALFWVRMIDERPEYFKLFEHIYGDIAYDNYSDAMQEYGEYDAAEDYMLKSGGIPIGGAGLYLKLNPSCLDLFRIFYGGPTEGVQGLNPLLQNAFKYSMYGLGYNSKDVLSDFDYDYDMNSFISDTVRMMPGINMLYDNYQFYTDKSYLYENAPNLSSKLLVAFCHTLFASELDFDTRSEQDFEEYQAALAKDGLWYDCNTGETRPLSEKNEIGANDPRINWKDVQYYMLSHFGKVWDGARGTFVLLMEDPNKSHGHGAKQGSEGSGVTSSPINVEVDWSDPNAWDKLCDAYEKQGKSFDYNIGKFVPTDQLSPGGLNDPDISFKERCRLYKEKFNKEWDANQGKFVEEGHMIPGGLNSIHGIENWDDWGKLKAYRSALFGEEWEYDEKAGKKKFIKTHEPKCVTLESLMTKTSNDAEYYQYVAVPGIKGVALDDVIIRDGIMQTRDGKYVLTYNEDYNSRVLDMLTSGSGSDTPSNWYQRNWGAYQRYTGRSAHKYKRGTFSPNPYQGAYSSDNNYKNFYDNFYRYQFQYNGQFRRSTNNTPRVHRTVAGKLIPYGGPFTKFSFYG